MLVRDGAVKIEGTGSPGNFIGRGGNGRSTAGNGEVIVVATPVGEIGVEGIVGQQVSRTVRSRSEENLLESRSTVSLASSHQRYEDRGISCSPASLKQSISIRSNDSSVGSARLNLSSRYGTAFVFQSVHFIRN